MSLFSRDSKEEKKRGKEEREIKEENKRRTPHQSPHTSHQIDQFSLDARVLLGGLPEAGVGDCVGPSDCILLA